MPSETGHNKASWEQAAGQADAMRFRAVVIWKMQVLPMLREAEEKYRKAERVRREPCPRLYDTYEQDIFNMRSEFSADA